MTDQAHAARAKAIEVATGIIGDAKRGKDDPVKHLALEFVRLLNESARSVAPKNDK